MAEKVNRRVISRLLISQELRVFTIKLNKYWSLATVFSSEHFTATLLCYIFAFCYYHLLFCCKINWTYYTCWKWWKFNKRPASNKRPPSRSKNLIIARAVSFAAVFTRAVNQINTVFPSCVSDFGRAHMFLTPQTQPTTCTLILTVGVRWERLQKKPYGNLF